MIRTLTSTLWLSLVMLISGAANGQNWELISTEFNEQYPSSPEPDRPGFILSVSDQDEILLSIKSGTADLEQGTQIDSNTVFHIASLSKQITGAALAFAIIDEKISLEDLVSDWIPEVEKYGSGLKVKHLVYMTSGLTEYANVSRTDQKPWVTFHYFSTADAIRASLSVESLQFEPGEQWQYSNINYMLITELIVKAYKMPFSAFVKDKIFIPLGMQDSLVNDDVTQLIPRRANAYVSRSDAVLNELNNNAKISVKPGDGYVMIRRNSPHYGGSGVMTSMQDWMKWQRELMTEKSFGKEFWKLMRSTMEFGHDKTNDAFGLAHGELNGESTLWYEGGDIDTSAYSITLLNQELNISCFSNNPLDSCRAKAEALIKLLTENK